jgi:thiamine pyrophosphokinase
MKAIIFSGGAYETQKEDVKFYHDLLEDVGLVIACNGGGSALLSLGIIPHVLIGDMDSIDDGVIDEMRGKGTEIIIQPREKDKTDTELAFDLALEWGAQNVLFAGALGGRVDHLLSNLSLLICAKTRGIPARIVDVRQELMLLSPKVKNEIHGNVGDTISLLSLSEKTVGVTSNDLKYPLKNGILDFISPLGVSNEIAGPAPSVVFEEGLLLLVMVRRP